MKQQAFYKKLSGLLKGVIALLVSLILFSGGEVHMVRETFMGITSEAPHYSWHYFIAYPLICLTFPYLVGKMLGIYILLLTHN